MVYETGTAATLFEDASSALEGSEAKPNGVECILKATFDYS